tara:strand:- start:1580 stop:2038 length:459 start_codon:yes stop_codon:yes gene_type:complete
LTEEPCQCPDCQRFYREHDRLIREFPTLKQQQELNWASIQSFRTLCGKVTEELQKKLSDSETQSNLDIEKNQLSATELSDSINELENINAYLFSIEALMEKIFETKVSEKIEAKFKEVAGELAPDPLNIDRIILNRLFHQTPDFPDKSTNTN